MTKNEEKVIDKLLETVEKLQKENTEFKNQVSVLVDSLNKKVENTYKPVSLEEDILKVAQSSISKAIADSLTGYGSPLVKIVSHTVEKHASEFESIIEEQIESLVVTESFKEEVKAQLSHSIVKSLVSGSDSLSQKTTSLIKSNPTLKAKMLLAIERIISEENIK